jgi:Gpi18-like mannosyltransferase
MDRLVRRRLSALGFVGAAFLLGRGALLLVVALVRARVVERPQNEDKDFVAFPAHPLWDSFCRWDSGWYDRIARLGYVAPASPGRQADVAFFPAFPYLSRWLGPLFGGHWAAGLVLANLALLGGLWFVYALAERHGGAATARRAVWLVLAYPATVFDSAYYS